MGNRTVAARYRESFEIVMAFSDFDQSYFRRQSTGRSRVGCGSKKSAFGYAVAMSAMPQRIAGLRFKTEDLPMDVRIGMPMT